MQQINIQYYNSPCGELILASVGDTVTSVLVPWTACGMTQSTVLGIPTLVYLPFCFFNIISPLMSCIVAILGLTADQRRTAICSSGIDGMDWKTGLEKDQTLQTLQRLFFMSKILLRPWAASCPHIWDRCAYPTCESWQIRISDTVFPQGSWS